MFIFYQGLLKYFSRRVVSLRLIYKIGLGYFLSLVPLWFIYKYLNDVEDVSVGQFLILSLLFLLFVVSLFIVLREPTRKSRLVFLNFALFFSTSIFFLSEKIVPLQPLYFMQYFSHGVYYVLLTLAIAYVAIDAVFRQWRSLQKFAITFLIVGGFAGFYYYPFIIDPQYAYHTENVRNWKELTGAQDEFKKLNDREPTVQELESVQLHSWVEEKPVGIFYPEENKRRIHNLYPYLFGSNYTSLVGRPIFLNAIYMNVVALVFILMYFGYQYKKDPPQGAYIDKIMFLFFLFCSLEILHTWSSINSVAWTTFSELMNLGRYISSGILAFIFIFFALRLDFITSTRGEYYEQEIVVRPTGVTRWRDWLDELLITHFISGNSLKRRLFAKKSED